MLIVIVSSCNAVHLGDRLWWNNRMALVEPHGQARGTVQYARGAKSRAGAPGLGRGWSRRVELTCLLMGDFEGRPSTR